MCHIQNIIFTNRNLSKPVGVMCHKPDQNSVGLPSSFSNKMWVQPWQVLCPDWKKNMLKTVCLIIATNTWVSMADIPVSSKKKINKVSWICTAWLKLVFLISLVPNAVNSSSVLSLPFKRISPQNPSNLTLGTQRMTTQKLYRLILYPPYPRDQSHVDMRQQHEKTKLNC